MLKSTLSPFSCAILQLFVQFSGCTVYEHCKCVSPYPYFKSLFVVHYELFGRAHQAIVLAGIQELLHILAGTILSYQTGIRGFVIGFVALSLLLSMLMLGKYVFEGEYDKQSASKGQL